MPSKQDYIEKSKRQINEDILMHERQMRAQNQLERTYTQLSHAKEATKFYNEEIAQVSLESLKFASDVKLSGKPSTATGKYSPDSKNFTVNSIFAKDEVPNKLAWEQKESMRRTYTTIADFSILDKKQNKIKFKGIVKVSKDMLKLLINKDSFASTLASNRADCLTKDKELVVLAERIAQVKLNEQTFTL